MAGGGLVFHAVVVCLAMTAVLGTSAVISPASPCSSPPGKSAPTEAARSQLAASMEKLKSAQKAIGSLPCPKANVTARKMSQVLQSLASTHQNLSAAGLAPPLPNTRRDSVVVKAKSKQNPDPVASVVPPAPGMRRG